MGLGDGPIVRIIVLVEGTKEMERLSTITREL